MVTVTQKLDARQPEFFLPDDMKPKDTGSLHWRLNTRGPVWRPPTDVYETEDQIVVRVEIAGVDEDIFTIELVDRFLYIRGSRTDSPERRAYHQMEIRFGEFSSEIELPAPVVVDEVQAVYNNGFLRIVLPKIRPQQVQVDPSA